MDSRSVHAVIVGEHGDSEVVAWSSANVSGLPLSEMCAMRGHYKHKENTAEIATAVKNSAYEIINKKHGMVKTRTVEMQTQLVGYEFKKKGLPTDKNIAVENSKVSNDYFWKTNKYTDQDVFGRTLDLTALINKPDGYLKGNLSDTEDVDYYKFNITEYRALSFAKDTYNKDITITLDHIQEIMYIKLMI